MRICGLVFLLGTGTAPFILGWKWWCMMVDGVGGWTGVGLSCDYGGDAMMLFGVWRLHIWTNC